MLILASRKTAPSAFAVLTKIVTFGKYTHSELVFSDNMAFSSDGKRGTRFIKADFPMSEWDFMDITDDPVLEGRVRVFCEARKGVKYDVRGVAFSFLPIPIGWQHASKWFCSEICCAALQQIGLLCGHTPASVSPKKLPLLLVKELPTWRKAQ